MRTGAGANPTGESKGSLGFACSGFGRVFGRVFGGLNMGSTSLMVQEQTLTESEEVG